MLANVCYSTYSMHVQRGELTEDLCRYYVVDRKVRNLLCAAIFQNITPPPSSLARLFLCWGCLSAKMEHPTSSTKLYANNTK